MNGFRSLVASLLRVFLLKILRGRYHSPQKYAK